MVGNSKGIFTVGALYKKLNHQNLQLFKWPWRHIWKAKIPYKVSCFVWLLAKEAVLTQENSMKRGITLCSDVFSVGKLQKQSIICLSNAKSLASCGICSLDIKASPGPCLGEFQRLYIARKNQGHKKKTEVTKELSCPYLVHNMEREEP